MQGSTFLIVCAGVSMAISLLVTIFYKRIRNKFRKNKYELPDKIPFFPELEDIPDKNKFIQSSYLLESGGAHAEASKEEFVVDALMTDEGARQAGFSLQGENLLLECVSPESTVWHEISEFPVIIGKSKDCGVRLMDEPSANDRHGLLFAKDGRYYYLDMNSMSGSIVDNVLADGVTEVGNGSSIRIRRTVIRLVMQSNNAS